MDAPSKLTIGKRFTFEAAHFLPKHPGACAQLHGHTYTIEVEVTGEPAPETGMIIDFYDLKNIVQTVISPLDHDLLNNLFAFRTTVENLCQQIAYELFQKIQKPLSVQIQEGEGGWARCQIG